MATPMKRFLLFAGLLVLLLLFNRFVVMELFGSFLRARFLRFQMTIFILCFLAGLNTFVWKNLADLPESKRIKENSVPSRIWIDFRKISNWQSYTVNELIWRTVLGIILTSSMLSYVSFSFFISPHPSMFAIWCWLCFGIAVQLFTAIVFITIFNFLCKQISNGRFRLNKHFRFQKCIAVVYALLIVCLGFYNIQKPPEIKEVVILMKNLPQEFNGLTITFVSDIHLGPTIGRQDMERIVHMINYIQSDLVIIGGDLVDGSVDQIGEAALPLDWIKAKHGIYFVTGNHEYYTIDADNWLQKLESLGVTALHNSNVQIKPSNGGAGICVAGVDDPTADNFRYEGHGVDLDKALGSCDSSLPVIFVAHQPATAKKALDTKYRLDLILSGHTHGGQMFPLTIGAYLFNPFYAGLYRHGDSTHVYVSMGTLYWGFPIRFMTRAEITKITLKSAL